MPPLRRQTVDMPAGPGLARASRALTCGTATLGCVSVSSSHSRGRLCYRGSPNKTAEGGFVSAWSSSHSRGRLCYRGRRPICQTMFDRDLGAVGPGSADFRRPA